MRLLAFTSPLFTPNNISPSNHPLLNTLRSERLRQDGQKRLGGGHRRRKLTLTFSKVIKIQLCKFHNNSKNAYKKFSISLISVVTWKILSKKIIF